MCHGHAVNAFPSPAPADHFHQSVAGFAWGNEKAEKRLAILPDIYGCNDFYRGLATRYAQHGARVYLIDTFDGLGDLPENSREAAFARRHDVADKAFVDRVETFLTEAEITGVIGFCLGGLYIFDLARRNVGADLIGLYGFPQGLPNDDPLPVPFDYLTDVRRPFSMLLGRDDTSVGSDNIGKLEDLAPEAKAMDLTVYEGVGHNFLPLLDSNAPQERDVALDALEKCDAVLMP